MPMSHLHEDYFQQDIFHGLVLQHDVLHQNLFLQQFHEVALVLLLVLGDFPCEFFVLQLCHHCLQWIHEMSLSLLQGFGNLLHDSSLRVLVLQKGQKRVLLERLL